MEHTLTNNIKSILKKNFGKNAETVFEKSLLVRYLNEKTRSANRGSNPSSYQIRPTLTVFNFKSKIIKEIKNDAGTTFLSLCQQTVWHKTALQPH